MVDRNPVSDYRPGAVLTEPAQVIPLHGQRTGGAVPAAPSPPRPGEHGERADAEVVRLPGTQPAESPSDSERSLLTRAVEFARRRVTGNYDVDEFGFDAELTEDVLLPLLRMPYAEWFRVSTYGVHNLPSTGGALLVCNHSGVLPIDALMTSVAVHDSAERHLRMLAADLVFQLPFVGNLARKTGHTLACNEDAERLLRGGELVGVFPEGFKGVGKPFSSRYKLQRFGRGGFVSAALRTGVPIIPCAIVGAEEIYPKIADIKPLARLLGLPYFPVTPFFPLLGLLGAIPLPTKWHIEFGEPIRTDRITEADGPADAAGSSDIEDPMLVFNLADRVREEIQQLLYSRLAQRPGVFR